MYNTTIKYLVSLHGCRVVLGGVRQGCVPWHPQPTLLCAILVGN